MLKNKRMETAYEEIIFMGCFFMMIRISKKSSMSIFGIKLTGDKRFADKRK